MEVTMAACCKEMFRRQGWAGAPGDIRVCPICRRSWCYQDGVWWKGVVVDDD